MQLRPLVGSVLPVAMFMAYVLSTTNVARPLPPISPCTALSSPVNSPALLLCLVAPWYILCRGDVTTLPYLALRNSSRPSALTSYSAMPYQAFAFCFFGFMEPSV